MQLSHAIKQFLEGYFSTHERSPKTRGAYAADLAQFLSFVEGPKDLTVVSPERPAVQLLPDAARERSRPDVTPTYAKWHNNAMIFEKLLGAVGDEPVFETGLLLAGDVDPDDVRRQLSRWVRKGRLYQLRRGLYALAPPYQKVLPHPFLVANRLVPGSYVSLQSALAHYGMIPEYVPITTSVTMGRPGTWNTPLGSFTFQHLHTALFGGFQVETLAGGEPVFLAARGKALADLVHLVPGADAYEYLSELRLANLAQLDVRGLLQTPLIAGRPKLRRAFQQVAALAEEEMEYVTV